ncbi:MAG: winged helix-turn-helix domain-containing protein [Nocardioidaceae bacterium]
MTVDPVPIARYAALLADPTRMAICLALIDGRAWTAGELARAVGVAPSTASAHLSSLVSAEVLAEQRQGRHRYLRLAGSHVAQLIEDLASMAGVVIPATGSLRSGRVATHLVFARTCYDHLAGRLGVALMDALVARGLLSLSAGASLTSEGQTWLTWLAPGTDLSTTRRPVVRPCLDWTERRPHLGGLAGLALRTVFVDRGWVVERPGERGLTVSSAGEHGLAELLDIDVPGLRAHADARA